MRIPSSTRMKVLRCAPGFATWSVSMEKMKAITPEARNSSSVTAIRATRIPCPGIPATLSFELACLAAAWSVNFVLMSPAYICLRFGIRYYSLSAHRQGFMLLLAAASLLAAGGALFAAVIRSRLSCAEYLWLCGRCKGALSALDCSWYLSEGSCGDLLRLKWLSLLFAPALSHLCAMNFSQKLLRRNGMPSRNALRIELIRDIRGEQFLELT